MKLVDIKTYENVRDLYLSKGYTFREGKYALNLGAIRGKESKSDKFDDLGWCAYRDENDEPQIQFFWLTTDPGKHWLLNPMNVDGCAIMVPGQYKEVYGAGKHKGEYEAFVQIKPMAYVRDDDKNETLDFSLYRDNFKRSFHVFWDIIGSNLHRASKWKIVNLVSNWSAGCMVLQQSKTFDKLIDLRNKSITFGYKKWDWTLFEEQ
jgi:hypothetical protein